MTSVQKDTPTFRFKFDQHIMDMLYEFGKLHQYDDRHTYKDEWKKWCEEHDEDLAREERRLSSLGYEGNMYDKLFKSGRYYFRKKPTVTTEPTVRRKYIGLNREILSAMDSFIMERVIGAKTSPADAFTTFCNEHVALLRSEVEALVSEHAMETDAISSKLKKTFKNRYFQLIKKA